MGGGMRRAENAPVSDPALLCCCGDTWGWSEMWLLTLDVCDEGGCMTRKI